MAKVLKRDELPTFDSTRDTRDRLDLVKGGVPAETRYIQADRIIYHPGDTCAKHYHIGAHHVFVMLEGEVMLCTPLGCELLKTGQTAVIQPEEVHWFENRSSENCSFVEFWAPPPTESVWIVENDV